MCDKNNSNMNLINGSEKPPRTLPPTGYADKEDQTTIGDDSPFLKEKPVSAIDSAENVLSASRKGVFHQILVTAAILLLAAACGMPIGYSAVILPQLFNETEDSPLSMDLEMSSWIASVHSLATPIGSFVSGPMMDKFGRRPALMISILPLVLGWILLATASSHFMIILGRIVAGIAVGICGAPAQVYIAEMAEPRLRGILIGAPFVFYSFGILLVYALGATLHWRLVAWCGCVLPILSLITLFLMPESPAWLARNNKMERASKALSWLRGGDLAAKTELLDLVARFKAEKQTSAVNETFWQSLNKMSVKIPLVIINLFQLLQIFSGTYLVVFYAVDIISEIGGEEMNTMTAAVLTAVTRLGFTIVFCFLLLFVKRRPMIIGSGLGSGIAAIVLSIFMYVRLGESKQSWDIYFTALTILVYIGSNTGFMCMPGIMIGELLPAKIRGQVAGYIFSLFNITLFLVAKVFPYAKQVLKTQGCFMVFGISSLVASLMLYLMLPETKEQSLGEIEDYFNQKNWLWFKRSRKSRPKPPTDEHCA